MKKTVTLLLLMLCFCTRLYAENINLTIDNNCKVTSPHKPTFEWDFSSELTLQAQGVKNSYKSITKSFIAITYVDDQKDTIKLTELTASKDDFKPVNGTPDIYKATLSNKLFARNRKKRIKSLILQIKCNGKAGPKFEIANSAIEEQEDDDNLNSTTIPCPCDNDSIYETKASGHNDTCGNSRKLEYIASQTNPCNISSHFGELPCYYTDHHKTYIYDFNKDISKRGFFKVWKKNGALMIEPVNFNKETLRPRDIVNFKVVHINQFMYNVSIADTLVTYDSEPSSQFNNLFLGDTNLLASLISKFSDDLTGSSHSFTDKDSKIEIELIPILCKLKCFTRKYNGLHAKMLQAYNPYSEFPCCRAEDYHSLANDLLEIKLLTARDEPFFNEKLKTLNEKKTKLNNNKVKKTELTGVQKKISDLTKKKKDEEEDSPELEALKKQENTLKAETLTDAEATVLASEIIELEKQLEPYKSLQSLHESLPSIADIRQMIVFLNNMVEQQQTYMTEITSLNGNRLDVTLNIAAKDSIGNIVPALKNFQFERHIEIPIIGRLFPSFSTGSFIGFSKSLKNKTYEWRRLPSYGNVVDDTSKYELAESGYSLPPMGFTALANGEIKLSPDFGVGASAGVGLTIEKTPRLSYLAGASVFLGDKRQFVITCGIMAAQVEQLNNNLNVGQHIYSSNSQPDIKYYKELKTGGFFSLTYTPFGESKKK